MKRSLALSLVVTAARCAPAPEPAAPPLATTTATAITAAAAPSAPPTGTPGHEAHCEKVGQRWGAAHEWMIALTWAPGYCAANPRAAGTDECAHPSAWSRENLGLHGLWPQWDSYCSGGDPRPAEECRAWTALPAPDVRDPGVTARLRAVMPGLDTQLDRHEWAKHGTCSGLAPDAYFGLAVTLDEQANQLGLGALLASRAAVKEPLLTARELCAAVRAKLGEPGASALQIESTEGPQGSQRWLVGVWFALADAPGPLALDAAHLRVNPKRTCGVAEETTYLVAP